MKAKKKINELTTAQEERYLIYGFRWEFLRRNEEYKGDFELYQNGLNNLKSNILNVVQNYRLKHCAIFKKKFGLRIPVNPLIPFFKLYKSVSMNIKGHLEKEFKTMVEVGYKLNDAYCDKYPAYFCESIVRDFERNEKCVFELTHGDGKLNIVNDPQIQCLKFAVRVNGTLERIIQDMTDLMKIWHAVECPKIKKDNRKRFDRYECNLKIFDYREKKKWGWAQIAAKFYPKDFVANPEYGKQKVKRDYASCRKMIEEVSGK
ncbi:MAG: hypothetical protein HQL25_01590 [Candidatus Omnitrophica bacterium]|nr:hypothetical protein [Candidatus Omnitrophota bacterium]